MIKGEDLKSSQHAQGEWKRTGRCRSDVILQVRHYSEARIWYLHQQ